MVNLLLLVSNINSVKMTQKILDSCIYVPSKYIAYMYYTFGHTLSVHLVKANFSSILPKF